MPPENHDPAAILPMPNAQQLEIKSTTGVPRDPNWFDRGGLAGILSGVGLATYLVVVQFPKMVEALDNNTKAMQGMQADNAAHYRAISDDRRVQFDQISRELHDVARDIAEMRREKDRSHGGAAPKDTP